MDKVMGNEIEIEERETPVDMVEDSAPESTENVEGTEEVEAFDNVSFGDDASGDSQDEAESSALVKKLRKAINDSAKERANLAKELEELKAIRGGQEAEMLVKPTLESCDYDTERFASELEDWASKRRQREEAQAAKQREAEQFRQSLMSKFGEYEANKGKLKVVDFEGAELAVQNELEPQKQGIILGCNLPSDKKAELIYALGRNPAKLRELAEIKDYYAFAVEVGRLAEKVKMTKKAPPTPETPLRTGGAVNSSLSADSRLDKLREEALRTGDLSKVMEYKRKHGNS